MTMMKMKMTMMTRGFEVPCQIPRLVSEKVPRDLEYWAVHFFSKPSSKATFELDRFGVERKICTRLYAPLLSAKGTVLAASLRVGDFLCLDGDTKVSWQITSVKVDY
jgi:hypothetical protein